MSCDHIRVRIIRTAASTMYAALTRGPLRGRFFKPERGRALEPDGRRSNRASAANTTRMILQYVHTLQSEGVLPANHHQAQLGTGADDRILLHHGLDAMWVRRRARVEAEFTCDLDRCEPGRRLDGRRPLLLLLSLDGLEHIPLACPAFAPMALCPNNLISTHACYRPHRTRRPPSPHHLGPTAPRKRDAFSGSKT